MMNAARLLILFWVSAAVAVAAAPAKFQLPGFPLPALVREGSSPKEISSLRLLRDLFRSGVKATDNFEAVDSDYALLKGDSLGNLAAWLESACTAVGYEIQRARGLPYDGVVFARLLAVGTSLAALREKEINLAMPIGVVVCKRAAAWGELPGDGADDAYVIFATDAGMLLYDPPTRQLTALEDFPNKAGITSIRF
jgi:hypothetical protein